jgi:glycosyltransferase involved in cell wall biosynthesis
MPHNYINSLNTGINAARGKYIARMDADDVMEPERLEVQFEYMETHPETNACGSYANYADGRTNKSAFCLNTMI